MEHSHEDYPLFDSQPQVQGATATGKLHFGEKRRHNKFLAFHEVKCVSEHFRLNHLIAYDSTTPKNRVHYFCPIFWAFRDKPFLMCYSHSW